MGWDLWRLIEVSTCATNQAQSSMPPKAAVKKPVSKDGKALGAISTLFLFSIAMAVVPVGVFSAVYYHHLDCESRQ